MTAAGVILSVSSKLDPGRISAAAWGSIESMSDKPASGGEWVAEVLLRQGVRFVTTLCGGHISPILVGCRARGIRVVDVRHEATAVFTADAIARLTGTPGVAAVTAGPGVTNAVTAVKNAQLAQSPLVLLGGATVTALEGRGSLQDIDQRALLAPHVKRVLRVRRQREIVPALRRAFTDAVAGVPGPVFVELPVDLLYPEPLVRKMYGLQAAPRADRGLRARLLDRYLRFHVDRLFAGVGETLDWEAAAPERGVPEPAVSAAARRLSKAERPVLLVGSQALLDAPQAHELARAVSRIGIPTYLSGMARGLLGPTDPAWLRHRRKEALHEADLVILAGTPCDFRLDYGRHIHPRAFVVSVNLSRRDLRRNRRPALAVLGAPGRFLTALDALGIRPTCKDWHQTLRRRDAEREQEIRAQSEEAAEGGVNPLRLCREIDAALADDSVVVADGGDFVATASYVLRPRGPLSWLDPGVFGTLGVGAGFALGARLCRPAAEVWLLYGDGSAGFSLLEADSFVRHGLPVIAVIGNDACWSQIAREQREMLHDDVGTTLRPTDYEAAAQGLGARGLRIGDPAEARDVLAEAKAIARSGQPVYVNARLGRSSFRKGSISL